MVEHKKKYFFSQTAEASAMFVVNLKNISVKYLKILDVFGKLVITEHVMEIKSPKYFCSLSTCV